MTYVASGTVKVSIGSAAGNRVARILRDGDVIPEGVDEETLARLFDRGLIVEVPGDLELAELAAALREEEELARQAEFDTLVAEAATQLVADRDAEAAKAAEAAQAAAAATPKSTDANAPKTPAAKEPAQGSATPPKPAGK